LLEIIKLILDKLEIILLEFACKKENSLKFDLSRQVEILYLRHSIFLQNCKSNKSSAKINIRACLRIWLCGILANKKRKQIKIQIIEASGNTLNLQTPCFRSTFF
jgi:hypothetical protein